MAEHFGVGVDWAFKISAARKRTGSMERVPQRRARPSRVDRVRVRSCWKPGPTSRWAVRRVRSRAGCDCARTADLPGRKRRLDPDDAAPGALPRSRRRPGAVPGEHWKMFTILDALSTQGMPAAMTVKAATDREVFLAFLDRRSTPSCAPAIRWSWTRLSAHKVAGVREASGRAREETRCPRRSPDRPPT